MKDIHPRPLARFLCKFVLKTPYGIGLGIPETMEMALQECGTPKILFAAAVSAVGKLFHKRGWFYKIAGYKARSIDGPCDYTLPPYNEYVVLGQPNRTRPPKRCPSAWAASRWPSPTSTTWKARFWAPPIHRWTATCWSKSSRTTRWASRWSRPNRHHPQSLKRTRQKKRVCKKERQKPLLFYHSLQTRSKISLRPDGGAEEMRTASR